jgi:aspartate/methionine/tyrosine aminotransferase
MGQVDPMGTDAVVCFEEVAEQATREGKKVKAILLCSPNNPLGLLVLLTYPSILYITPS